MSEVHDKSLEAAKEWLDNIPDEKFLIEYLQLEIQCMENLLKYDEKVIKQLVDTNNDLQYKIDQLMLEFCPEEMTQEQIENWKQHQVKSNYPKLVITTGANVSDVVWTKEEMNEVDRLMDKDD